MTLPESAGGASPDDPGPAAGDRQPDQGEPPASADQLLTEKPVLEWTKEDWAHWIETSSRAPVASPEPTPGVIDAFDTSEMRETREAGDVDEAADEGQGPPIVDIRLPEEEPDGSVADRERPWDEPPELADLGAEVEPSPPSRSAHVIADSDRPWDEPPELATQLEGKLQHEELARPPLVWPPGDDRPTMPGTLLRQQPVAPPAALRRSSPQPRVVAEERSHRIRSVFALLGVAVSVGVIVAGLITVTFFVVGVALRRAVG